MFKVLFDAQIFTYQVYGGISRYFSQLIKNFDFYNNFQYELSLIYSDNHYLKKNLTSKIFGNLNNIKFKGRDRVLNLLKDLNQKKSVKRLKSQNYDIFHPTYYDSYFLNYLGAKPFVLTVYDMIHEIYVGEYFGENDITIKRKKELIQKATKIIAISNNTKNDIVKLYGIDKEKIEVIYLSNSLDSNKYKEIMVPQTFILFVGSRVGYKNFKFFIEAIFPLLLKNKNLMIVCAGGGNWREEEINFFKRNRIENRIFQYSTNDEQLVYLYKKALAFIFPSQYEGFGIPILEAFTCGCPVALSNTSSFPEVAQDAVLYFDPFNKESIYFAVEKAIYDKEIRKKNINLGLNCVKEFSWKNATKKTINVYKSLL